MSNLVGMYMRATVVVHDVNKTPRNHEVQVEGYIAHVVGNSTSLDLYIVVDSKIYRTTSDNKTLEIFENKQNTRPIPMPEPPGRP